MMAGTGVRVGGAGMLRARRRDCSVKPNRKLDRKSSRGMIYENEELRLRTIHINAEVEQGKEFMILPDYYVSIGRNYCSGLFLLSNSVPHVYNAYSGIEKVLGKKFHETKLHRMSQF